MKSITEFPTHKLQQGIELLKSLSAEGKTPEEVQAKIGETFKYEGDKIKYFINAAEVAAQNLEKLIRVQVVSFAEGENTPDKAVKKDEQYYLPEYAGGAPKPVATVAKGGGGKPKGGRDGGGKPKSSPWGLSPEEIAAKKAASLKANAAKATKTN